MQAINPLILSVQGAYDFPGVL